jgi:hypothetical protein
MDFTDVTPDPTFTISWDENGKLTFEYDDIDEAGRLFVNYMIGKYVVVENRQEMIDLLKRCKKLITSPELELDLDAAIWRMGP